MRKLLILPLMILMVLPLAAQDDAAVDTRAHNISQSADGVTVTLDQSYADAKQIHAWFTVEGIELPEGRLMGAPVLFVLPVLPDADPTAIGGIGSQIDFEDDGTIKAFFTFDLEIPVEDLLEVIFDVQIGQTEGMPLYLVPDGVPPIESANDEYLYEFPYNVDFEFPLMLDVAPAQTIVTNFSETSNDLSLSIEDVTITPIFAEVPVCFDLPDAGDWQPVIDLVINGESAILQGFGLDQLPSAEATRRCTTFDFRLDGVETVETIAISIDGYRASLPEVVDADRIALAQERLDGTGIVVDYGDGTRGMQVIVTAFPDSMTESDAYMEALNALKDRYEASWDFAFEVESS